VPGTDSKNIRDLLDEVREIGGGAMNYNPKRPYEHMTEQQMLEDEYWGDDEARALVAEERRLRREDAERRAAYLEDQRSEP
jgi:hypothetical protein